MDFSLTDTQEVFKSTAQKFFKEKCTTLALTKYEQSEKKYSPELYKEIAELGFLGLIIPEKYDGVGGNLMDLAIVVEEAGYAALPAPFFSTIAYGILPILDAGTEAQKSELLPQIAKGELIFTGAFSESHAHYDLKHINTTAANNTLSGQKLFVPYASSADYFLTLARTSENSQSSSEGLSLYLINGKQSGIKTTPLRSIGTDELFEVNFENVSLSDSDRLGAENEGWSLTKKTLETATALQCVEMVGLLRRALEVTNEYVKERKQFNVPIGSFQSVQHRLSDMFTIVEGGKLAAYQAIWRLSEGLSAEKEIAIAKAWLCKEGQRVMTGAFQLHGGMGIDMDYPLQFCFRRFKSMQLNLGPTPIQLDKIGNLLAESSQPEMYA